jgi:hypothetical protein
MDILNFIYWIRQRRVLKTLPKNSLIPVGVKDPRRDDRYLTCAIKASDLGLGEGGSTTGEYRMSQFADTIVSRTDFDESIVGQYFDATEGKGRLFGSGIFVELENGNLAIVSYCQSVLESGILIYEAYDVLGDSRLELTGYWIAYKQDPNDSERLIKVGELQMTQQFWNNWYNYTAKDSGPNAVKFVSTDFNPSVGNSVESYITKLTWTGSALVAEDIYFDFGGETFQSLYSSLTGITVFDDTPNFQLYSTEYILDDDYYGMAMGAEAGWCFYRNTVMTITAEEQWITAGYNILTGETKWVDPIPVIATLTNFDPLDPDKIVIQDWINHPGGLVYSFSDDKVVDNGDNNDGVTAIWSPYWESNTECIYLGIRKQFVNVPDDVVRLLTYGKLKPVVNLGEIFGYYWDNKAFYFLTNSRGFSDQVYIVHKYHIETKEVTSYTLPYLTLLDEYSDDIGSSFFGSWANNDGLFFNVYTFKQLASWSLEKYQYVKHENSKIYKFHLDISYPSHAFKDKIYNINTMASYNFDTLGVSISTYKKMKF